MLRTDAFRQCRDNVVVRPALAGSIDQFRTEQNVLMAAALVDVVMLGEKCLDRNRYLDGTSAGDDQSMFLGDDADIRRFTAFPPRYDTSYDEIQLFGSAHANGCYVGLGDGSVRFISYQINGELFRRLGNRHDGNVTRPSIE